MFGKMETNRKGVVLLSGGLDSTSLAAKAKSVGYELYSMTIEYGQRHEREIDRARRVSNVLGIPWRIGRVMAIKDLF